MNKKSIPRTTKKLVRIYEMKNCVPIPTYPTKVIDRYAIAVVLCNTYLLAK